MSSLLSTVAFHHSQLVLSVAGVSSHPRDVLVPPASFGVHSLTFDLSLQHRNEASTYASLMQLLVPPLSTVTSRFSSLRQLSLRLHSYNVLSHTSLLSTIISSTAALPVLERLTLWNDDADAVAQRDSHRPNFCLNLSALANLPALRHLTLCLPLYADDYADIFSLPGIHTIHLCNSRRRTQLYMPLAVLTALPSLLSPSCRTLRLPELGLFHPHMPHGAPRHTSSEPAKQLMELIRQQAAGRADGLQYLAVTGGSQNHALLLAPAFPSLTALRVDSMGYPHDAAAVLPAIADLPCLQHLSVVVGEWADESVWEQFLTRVGSRLRTVHLHELNKRCRDVSLLLFIFFSAMQKPSTLVYRLLKWQLTDGHFLYQHDSNKPQRSETIHNPQRASSHLTSVE